MDSYSTPMKQSSPQKLDAPPPLPSEATRKPKSKPVDWMSMPGIGGPNSGPGGGPGGPGGGLGLGADAANPMIQLLDISKQMESLVQRAQALAPQTADIWAAQLASLGQATAQTLASLSQPPPGSMPGMPGAGPGMGMGQGPMGGMLPPGMPMPPGPGPGPVSGGM